MVYPCLRIARSLLPILAAAPVSASITDVAFVDRGSAGEITLGAMRYGMGVIDVNQDGYPDLIFSDSIGKGNRLFINVPDLTKPGARNYVDATAGSGLNDADGAARDGIGVLTADYDNDGDDDAFIIGRAATTYGLLYRNDGGTFTNVSVESGVRRTGALAEAASWADYDLDGWVDLVVIQTVAPYVTLLRNNGAGGFVSASHLLPTIPAFSHCYSASWIDFDQDGWGDLFLISNSGVTALLRNLPGPTGGRVFQNQAIALGYTQHGPAPMGIAPGDYDNDGDIDIGISDAFDGTYYRNDSGVFTNLSLGSTHFGWGVAWLDADNDTRLDFYTAGSWAGAAFDNLQYNLGGGAFQNISPQLGAPLAASQFSVQLDHNNDGRVDLVTNNPNQFVSVYENRSAGTNNSITVELRGVGAGVNRSAIGAFVRLKAGGTTQVREVYSGTSTTASEDRRLHVGLGSLSSVDEIEVTWPRRGTLSERTERYEGPFAANQIVIITPQKVCADFSGDGIVTDADLGLLLLDWQLQTGAADLDGDDAITDSDLGLLLNQFGQACW